MKTTILATAAILGLATGGAAVIERAHVSLQQLAASGQPELSTNVRGTQAAAATYPVAMQQHAANGLPQSRTNERGTQYAASGLPQSDTSRPSQV